MVGEREQVYAAAIGGSPLGPQTCPESLEEEEEILHQPPAEEGEARPASLLGEESEVHTEEE